MLTISQTWPLTLLCVRCRRVLLRSAAELVSVRQAVAGAGARGLAAPARTSMPSCWFTPNTVTFLPRN